MKKVEVFKDSKGNLFENEREYVLSRLSMQDILNYEVHSNRFASWIGFEWGQNLMGKYFAWKVRRKYNRYIISLEERKRVLNGL